MCSSFEDMLIFPNFTVAFDEEMAWLCNAQQWFFICAEDTEYPRWTMYHSASGNQHCSSAETRKGECVTNTRKVHEA